MPARLQSLVVDQRKRDSRHHSRNNGHRVNNTSIPAGGNNSSKVECRACGFGHQLADCRNVTPSKRQFLLERQTIPFRQPQYPLSSVQQWRPRCSSANQQHSRRISRWSPWGCKTSWQQALSSRPLQHLPSVGTLCKGLPQHSPSNASGEHGH